MNEAGFIYVGQFVVSSSETTSKTLLPPYLDVRGDLSYFRMTRPQPPHRLVRSPFSMVADCFKEDNPPVLDVYTYTCVSFVGVSERVS